MSEVKEIKAIKFYDALKKNNAPRIQVRDSYGNERTVFDPTQKAGYFDKSDETGRNIRWGVHLSDGRDVSMDGLLRITEPEVWERYSGRLKGKKIEDKNQFIIGHTMDSEAFDNLLKETFEFLRTQDVFSQTYRGYDDEGKRKYTEDLNGIKVNKVLSEEGHPLAGLFFRDLILKDGKKVNPNQRYLWEEHVKEQNEFNKMAEGGEVSEVFVHPKTILIRSLGDKKFRFDITYDKNNKIIKTEIQGDIQDKMNEASWLNLIVNVNVGKNLDYNQLRAILSTIPELYVEDIMAEGGGVNTSRINEIKEQIEQKL